MAQRPYAPPLNPTASYLSEHPVQRPMRPLLAFVCNNPPFVTPTDHTRCLEPYPCVQLISGPHHHPTPPPSPHIMYPPTGVPNTWFPLAPVTALQKADAPALQRFSNMHRGATQAPLTRVPHTQTVWERIPTPPLSRSFRGPFKGWKFCNGCTAHCYCCCCCSRLHGQHSTWRGWLAGGVGTPE